MRASYLVPLVVLVVVPLACEKKGAEPGASSAAPTATSPAMSAQATSTAAPSAAVPGKHASEIISTKACEAKLTPLHHATMLLQCGDQAIYFDPVSDVSYDGLPKADVILVTDIHGDHMDQAAIDKLKTPKTKIVAPPAVADKLAKDTVNVVIKNGESQTVGPLKVDAVPMYNLTRGPKAGQLFHDKGRGNGYVVTLGDKRLYISGDTECIPEMKALKDIDVAFVCMNLPYTMPPEEAAQCVSAFKPKVVYPYHYKGSDLGVFQKAVAPGTEVRLRDWYAP